MRCGGAVVAALRWHGGEVSGMKWHSIYTTISNGGRPLFHHVLLQWCWCCAQNRPFPWQCDPSFDIDGRVWRGYA